MERQCQLAEVSRAGFYRYLQQTLPEQADLLLRARLQELAVAHHRLRGYRMLTELLRREGQVVNHKRVLRLMREDNLLSLRRMKYVFTTDSRHNLPIYPNLARRVSLTKLNQLWVADITFIRLRSEFVYLAVVLDAYSRRVIGCVWDARCRLSWRFGLCRWRSTSATGKPRNSSTTQIEGCSTRRVTTRRYWSSARFRSA